MVIGSTKIYILFTSLPDLTFIQVKLSVSVFMMVDYVKQMTVRMSFMTSTDYLSI